MVMGEAWTSEDGRHTRTSHQVEKVRRPVRAQSTMLMAQQMPKKMDAPKAFQFLHQHILKECASYEADS